MRLAQLAALFCFTVASFACDTERDRVWSRYDLTTEPVAEGDVSWKLLPLGLREQRSVGRRPAAASVVRGLEQRVSERWTWRLELGREAFFRFRPLPAESAPCACGYHVLIEAGGRTVSLVRVPVPTKRSPAPAPVVVPLDAYRGPIRLHLELEGEAGASDEVSAVWASPAVYHRTEAPELDENVAPSRPDVVLITADTLRADYLGAYGAPAEASPNLDRFADRSDVWLEAHSTSNSTNPSHASIMTGLYPKHHGVYDLKTSLDDAFETLAERFAAAGYETLAVVSVRHLGAPQLHLTQGFRFVVSAPPRDRFSGELVVDTAMSLVSERRDRPLFMWVHLFDTHTPHTAPAPFGDGARSASGVWTMRPPVSRAAAARSDGSDTLGRSPFSRATYSDEVAFLDHQVGRLLAFLESRGAESTTLIAFVSDHGEQLGEHGNFIGHRGLHDTVTHVPLMIHWPGQVEGRRLPGIVQTLDLYPTLLAAAGLPVPERIDGLDLRSLGPRGRGVAFAEAANHFGTMVRTPSHKLFRLERSRVWEPGDYLFDIAADAGETTNIAGRGLDVERQLRERLEWFSRNQSGPDASPVPLTREEREALEALGYVP